ncbi:MAG: hypothetical protein L6R41_001519 [Letrouitia leprolyta]|nr:MAG: hypothetical protein L6R41_001519 [Letrouitia leprolyta]
MSATQTMRTDSSTNIAAAPAIELRDNIQSSDSIIPPSAVEIIPDGGYGWTVVFACSTVTFMMNGWTGSWGIFQTAIFQEYPTSASTTSLSFVGTVALALCTAFGLACVRASRQLGARRMMLAGVLMHGFGIIFSSFTVRNLGGLFGTAAVMIGLGISVTFSMSNTLPVLWFSNKLGTAHGVVKLGGGIGSTVMAIVVQLLIEKVGIPWTFRIVGFITLASGIPAALLVKERGTLHRTSFVDWSLFRSLPFSCMFIAGAIGTFALHIPPYFLPLFAHSIGLSASTGAGIVAAFNGCAAVGRFAAGFACDKLGSTNVLLLTMILNAMSMLAVWPVSETLGPLILFAALNGVANGSFFVAMPTAINRVAPPGKAAVGMGMAITGWTGGYLMGSPIAGMLIAATGAEKAHGVEPYRAAIFYAGGIALMSAGFVLVARLGMDTKVMKRL